MFVTISLLIDELEVVKERIYNASLLEVKTETYLESRRSSMSRFAYTPVRVVVVKFGSPDIHVVEFTGHHYAVVVNPHDNGRFWWASTGTVPDVLAYDKSGISPLAYTYQPFVSTPETRQLTETESLLHDYALTLADDYFNDRFHLEEKE